MQKSEAIVRKHHHVRESAGSRVFDIVVHVLLIIVGLMCLLPFLHVAAMSFSSNGASSARRCSSGRWNSPWRATAWSSAIRP